MLDERVIETEDKPHKTFAFLMEMQAGMRTQYLNWRDVVSQMPEITAEWIPITYYKENGFIEKMKFLPNRVRQVARSYRQVEEGLGKTHFDAVLFNTYNPAVVHRRSVKQQRAFLMFDVTPIQYDKMAVWYDQTPDNPRLWLTGYKHRRVCEAFQGAAGLIVWTHWAAQSAIQDYGADPKKISIVPPGVDPHKWKPGVKPQDGITRLLFTGGAFRRKGGDLLLKWAKNTQKKNWELHIVTYDPVENPPPGVIVHHGVDNNAPAFIQLAQSCDIFVLPTRADCFSIASLEAMATGMPVITCNVGGIGDIVREGETGHLIEPEDYDALHDRIESLLEAPERCAEMGRRGREIVIEHFDAKELVKRGIEVMAA